MPVYRADDYEYISKNYGEKLLTQSAKAEEECIDEAVKAAVEQVEEDHQD